MDETDVPRISTVRCIKGNRALGFVKGRVYPVLSTDLEPRNAASILIQKQDRNIRLFVVHVNRLQGEFNGNNGDPTKSARFLVDGYKPKEPRRMHLSYGTPGCPG